LVKVTHIRNATLLLEFQSGERNIGLLIDPMLAPKATLPSLKYFGVRRQRNPLVELPLNTPELLARVTHCLITHCQRGHFDHLDRTGKKFVRDAGIPVICMPRDVSYLSARGILTQPLLGEQTQPFFHGHITPIPCVHGRGLIGSLMEHGHGYFIDLPNELSIYIAGDTLLTNEVRRCLNQRQPQVSVLPGGGARFDLGAKILMDGTDVLDACSATSGIVVVNHLQALDHCPTTRAELRAAAVRAGLMERVRIAQDGETFDFNL
jgi:L-ascorbate metabolism protein UlaG (beta-lactamase superfamily)